MVTKCNDEVERVGNQPLLGGALVEIYDGGYVSREDIDIGSGHLTVPFSAMNFPFRSCNAHEQLYVLDWDPAGENFHGVFEIGFKDDVAHPVYQGSGGGVEDVETPPEGAGVGLERRRVWISVWYA